MARIARRSVHRTTENGFNLQFVQLVVSLVLLGAVLIARAFMPEEVQVFLNEHIKSGVATTEVLETIGGGIQGFFNFVPAPSPIGQGTAGSLTEASGSPAVQPSDQPQTEPDEVSGAAGEVDTVQADGTTEGKTGYISAPLAAGGFAGPIVLIDEDYLPIGEDDEFDDTLPLPFGMEAPERVDYSVYELPFITQVPVMGSTVTSEFGYRTHPIDNETGFHYGLDMAAPKGTDITAFADGTVVLAGNSTAYGLYLIVQHEGGYATLYGHCDKLLAKNGQKVRMGDKIARVGMTGKATGYHLHFEIRKGDSLLNPAYYLDL